MASFEDYTKWFERKENGNWLKVSVGLIITKHGLAPFVVRDIGRKVRHASQIEVTDADLKQWFDDMRALFQIPQHFAANSDAQNTIDLLNKLETDQLHIERTDVLAAIKDIVTSLERLTSSTDAETLADNIKKFRDIQQKIAAEAEEHKRDICDFVDGKKDDLTHHANVSISDIDKKIEANQQSLNELKTEVKEHKRDIGELADRKKADLTQYAKELILDIDQKLEADQQSLNVFKKELKDNLLQHHSKINSTLLLGPFFSEGDASLKDFYVQPQLSETDVVHSIEEIVFAHLETEIGYQREDRERLEKIFMDDRGLVILDGLDESSLSILKPPMANRKYNRTIIF
ncbi:hypothetical protein MAR_035981 [Mya arenaria]|uniref:Uncharacterized protein n=1 Tax=Mya arenaria TaxID=6604 RepID=A0ABY7EM58_MYAAR|nr:hypothetical protein MAR_035981 [Mya arenaria]